MLKLTLPWIWNHPLVRCQRLNAYGRYAWWQCRRRLTATPYAMAWVNRTQLVLEPAMRGATGNLYVGLHEWPDMAFVLHLLRTSDHFLDIGSNVGTYTVLAAGAIGCNVTAAEPTPQPYAAYRPISGLTVLMIVSTLWRLVSAVAQGICISALIAAP